MPKTQNTPYASRITVKQKSTLSVPGSSFLRWHGTPFRNSSTACSGNQSAAAHCHPSLSAGYPGRFVGGSFGREELRAWHPGRHPLISRFSGDAVVAVSLACAARNLQPRQPALLCKIASCTGRPLRFVFPRYSIVNTHHASVPSGKCQATFAGGRCRRLCAGRPNLPARPARARLPPFSTPRRPQSPRQPPHTRRHLAASARCVWHSGDTPGFPAPCPAPPAALAL